MHARRARPLLGTLVDIGASGRTARTLLEAIEAAFGEVAAVHRLMSFHCPHSDVSRLNRAACNAAVRVDARTVAVIACALDLARASCGRFDPTIAARLVARGFLPQPCNARTPRDDASWRDIEILDREHIRLRKPLWLDLGGIAKGYAVDRAIECLRACDVATALVNAGGDLRRFGRGTQTIHARDPRAPLRLVPLIELGEGAVATSASYFFAADGNGGSAGPYLDGATREFVDMSAASVTVLANTCIVADALTKIVLADPTGAENVLHMYAAQAVRSVDDRWHRLHDAA